MKNVLVFIGSPRRGGNSDVLAQHAAQAARETGAAVEIHYLNELDYQGCQGCLGCKRGDACVLEDDLAPIYDKIYEAHAVIFASPVCYNGVSGQMKSFLGSPKTRLLLSTHRGVFDFLFNVPGPEGQLPGVQGVNPTPRKE